MSVIDGRFVLSVDPAEGPPVMVVLADPEQAPYGAGVLNLYEASFDIVHGRTPTLRPL